MGAAHFLRCAQNDAVAMSLQFDGKLFEACVKHLVGNDGLDGIDYGIDEAFAHIILTNDKRYFTHRSGRGKHAHMLLLIVVEQGKMQLGDDGVASVLINDLDECIDAARLVGGRVGRLGLAEVEYLITHAVTLLQNPQVLGGHF